MKTQDYVNATVHFHLPAGVQKCPGRQSRQERPTLRTDRSDNTDSYAAMMA